MTGPWTNNRPRGHLQAGSSHSPKTLKNWRRTQAACEHERHPTEAELRAGLLVIRPKAAWQIESLREVSKQAAIADRYVDLGYFYSLTEQANQAEIELKKALAIDNEVYGENSVASACDQVYLALLQKLANKRAKGICNI
ncbi:MAG: hypothetical protein IPP57_21600 [Candidatus Obscuribacter sp.]|nr:hypothetical protein [Candidatus Obscuribacter sp.]